MDKILFADTYSELNSLSVGLYHDHCYHIYRGKTIDILDKYEYKDLLINTKKYCIIYKEYKPIE